MISQREAVLANDYEPFDNRIRAHQTNRFETLVHLIKGILGTGIMAMPEAFMRSGFLPGIVGSIVFTGLITYCLHILFGAMYFVCKRDKIPQITYPQCLKEGLLIGPNCLRKMANAAPLLVNFFIITYQLGVMCIYLLFTANNLKQVVDQYTAKDKHFSDEMYMIFLLLPFMAVCYIKDLKMLAPFSNVANWLTLLGLIFIYYFLYEKVEPISQRKWFGPILEFPLFAGTSMFAVLSIGAILSIELNMKNCRYWGGLYGTLNQGMFVVTILNIFTGFSGYWKYGQKTESSITLNLDKSQPLTHAIRILFCLAIYVSYSLQAYPISEILWEQYVLKYMETTKYKLLWDYIIRTILVLFSFILAISIPKLGLFISLFGSFCLSFLGIIFPALLDICIRWPDNFGKKKLILVRDIVILIFGILAFCTGTYCALSAIVTELIEDNRHK